MPCVPGQHALCFNLHPLRSCYSGWFQPRTAFSTYQRSLQNRTRADQTLTVPHNVLSGALVQAASLPISGAACCQAYSASCHTFIAGLHYTACNATIAHLFSNAGAYQHLACTLNQADRHTLKPHHPCCPLCPLPTAHMCADQC
jgi:hypothetical protein